MIACNRASCSNKRAYILSDLWEYVKKNRLFLTGVLSHCHSFCLNQDFQDDRISKIRHLQHHKNLIMSTFAIDLMRIYSIL